MGHRIGSLTGRMVAAVAVLGLAACQTAQTAGSEGAVQTAAYRSAEDQRIGDKAHAKILGQFGGAYRNPGLQAYIGEIGARISAVSEQPGEKWTFTILDTPRVNAFALPGGYVYVTRGLLALANDEAQLAGVIGHEIAHVTAGHATIRRDRQSMAQIGLTVGQIGLAAAGLHPGISAGAMQAGQLATSGALARYSRSDELEADSLGVRYLAQAGYDPYAQAEFLDSMTWSSALRAQVAGKRYNPNRVEFFSSHPATADRTREAILAAEQQGAIVRVGADRARERYLKQINGIAYGDSEAHGFVRGRRFSHPLLRFTYLAPRGFEISNASRAVRAEGPKGARFILDGARSKAASLSDYIRKTWVPGLAKSTEVAAVGTIRTRQINGLEAAEVVVEVKVNNRPFEALLVAVRLDGALYRLTGLVPGGSGLMPAVREAAESFRKLSIEEAKSLKPKRVVVTEVREGDSIEALAAKMRVADAPREQFEVLNGLKEGDLLVPGQKVKLIR
ncbi:MAG: M48 family metalloprotease [Pseudomonadota bacterium]